MHAHHEHLADGWEWVACIMQTAPRVWNAASQTLREYTSATVFRLHLKLHLFSVESWNATLTDPAPPSNFVFVFYLLWAFLPLAVSVTTLLRREHDLCMDTERCTRNYGHHHHGQLQRVVSQKRGRLVPTAPNAVLHVHCSFDQRWWHETCFLFLFLNCLWQDTTASSEPRCKVMKVLVNTTKRSTTTSPWITCCPSLSNQRAASSSSAGSARQRSSTTPTTTTRWAESLWSEFGYHSVRFKMAAVHSVKPIIMCSTPSLRTFPILPVKRFQRSPNWLLSKVLATPRKRKVFWVWSCRGHRWCLLPLG